MQWMSSFAGTDLSIVRRNALLVAMARFALREHRPVEHVERREQRRRAVTNIVVRDAFDVAPAQRQHGLRVLERLALVFLVHAKHQGVVRCAQVQTHDIAKLLDEERISGQRARCAPRGIQRIAVGSKIGRAT